MKTFLFCSALWVGSLFGLSPTDEESIKQIIDDYTNAWNFHQGKGFGDHFSQDADFVNIFGMKFSGKEEIEERHVKILQTFHKDSQLTILDTKLREIQPGLVIAHVVWRLYGFRMPGSDTSIAGEIRQGIFTQVFLQNKGQWEITASQNTLSK